MIDINNKKHYVFFFKQESFTKFGTDKVIKNQQRVEIQDMFLFFYPLFKTKNAPVF